MTDYRRKIGQKKPTRFQNLRPLEQKLSGRKYKTVEGLLSWFAEHGFNEIQWPLGEQHDCDYQCVRSMFGGRLHVRIYVFPKRFVIESHYDKSDPNTSTIAHMWEALFGTFDHHVIEIQRR